MGYPSYRSLGPPLLPQPWSTPPTAALFHPSYRSLGLPPTVALVYPPTVALVHPPAAVQPNEQIHGLGLAMH